MGKIEKQKRKQVRHKGIQKTLHMHNKVLTVETVTDGIDAMLRYLSQCKMIHMISHTHDN